MPKSVSGRVFLSLELDLRSTVKMKRWDRKKCKTSSLKQKKKNRQEI
ncbi:hypothetical protein LEMLEM_LOCUS4827 [Lemmus lemmus]